MHPVHLETWTGYSVIYSVLVLSLSVSSTLGCFGLVKSSAFTGHESPHIPHCMHVLSSKVNLNAMYSTSSVQAKENQPALLPDLPWVLSLS